MLVEVNAKPLPVVKDDVEISNPLPVVSELKTFRIPAVAPVPVVTPLVRMKGLEPIAKVLVPVAVPPEANNHAPEADAGVCHVAAVPLVAVNTCPLVGAVAELTFTVVVADFKALVIPEVNPVAVPVMLVPTNAEGVPNAGVVKVGEVVNATLPVPLTVYSPSTPLLL